MRNSAHKQDWFERKNRPLLKRIILIYNYQKVNERMARLEKSTDSPSMSSSKKAKRAAAKAKQDLEEELASEILKTAQPDPAAIDASLA